MVPSRNGSQVWFLAAVRQGCTCMIVPGWPMVPVST